ncbi:hypothetical protein KQ51_00140 [Candidatus Izimaplasma bacterium HR1]|jgi:hypothetical protein|uniref:hypothetical protein n=1 Tax=Candidatus Izimoplasma sp. HR1 TaxID=1541959 RepID=UPI0004F58A9C|nr:hypothetical protein KQ51_00140 [Candidatus Izimaplasma bacterium HR1]
MIKYIKMSIPTIVLIVMMLLLQFVPGYFSTITTTVLIVAYFVHMKFIIDKKEISKAFVNMFEFCLILLIYVTVVEVIL